MKVKLELIGKCLNVPKEKKEPVDIIAVIINKILS